MSFAIPSTLHNLIRILVVFTVGRLFTAKIAAFYEEYYKSKGVNFIKGTVVTSFENDSRGKVTSFSINHLSCSSLNFLYTLRMLVYSDPVANHAMNAYQHPVPQ